MGVNTEAPARIPCGALSEPQTSGSEQDRKAKNREDCMTATPWTSPVEMGCKALAFWIARSESGWRDYGRIG